MPYCKLQVPVTVLPYENWTSNIGLFESIEITWRAHSQWISKQKKFESVINPDSRRAILNSKHINSKYINKINILIVNISIVNIVIIVQSLSILQFSLYVSSPFGYFISIPLVLIPWPPNILIRSPFHFFFFSFFIYFLCS